MDDSSMIKAGDSVVIRMHDDRSTMIIKVQGEQKICRSKVATKALVGCPYGSVFQIIDRKLQRIKDDEDDSLVLDGNLFGGSVINADSEDLGSSSLAGGDASSSVVAGDNRGYVDSNTAQKLRPEDIRRLREAGASGKDIIQSLIANSDTWAAKTEFAQAKWLKKKQQKYFRRLRVVKCCPATVCEVYHEKNKDKICGLRWDSLAQLLSNGGVHSGMRVLVFDGVLGMVVGSVAYRLRGQGKILAAFAGQQPHFTIGDFLNLDDESLGIIQTIPSEELGLAADFVCQNGFLSREQATLELENALAEIPDTATIIAQRRLQERDHDCSISSSGAGAGAGAGSNNDETGNSRDDTSGAPGDTEAESEVRKPKEKEPQKPHHSSGRQPQQLAVIRSELKMGANSLVIATKHHPLPILKEALNLLAPSSPFAVYCEFMEPLVECYLYVTDQALAVKVALGDTWSREYQTLPGRFHPQMFMSACSGYILSGIYVGMPEVYMSVVNKSSVAIAAQKAVEQAMAMQTQTQSQTQTGDDRRENGNEGQPQKKLRS